MTPQLIRIDRSVTPLLALAPCGQTPLPTASAAQVSTKQRREEVEQWVKPLGWGALAVFVSIPLAAPLMQNYAGRVVWTVLVAALPLFIVLVGYHRWRRICPLAFFAHLPQRLGRPGRRRASARLEANYYYVSAGIFFISLWLRLIATNGDGLAISAFFVSLALAALIFGLLYTGKTWCNYFCPVSFVEKVYTEPHGLRKTRNSQCVNCTACKRSCPDINQENGYLREINSGPKRIAYFAFPGLVLGFYLYYYLQSGGWSYYFDGGWTNEPHMLASALLPGRDAKTAGFFFLPVIPRAAASLFTLALCGLASSFLFATLERGLAGRMKTSDGKLSANRARHISMSFASFTALVTFYTFAGAPTLRKLPSFVPRLFLIGVVIVATVSLLRRLNGTRGLEWTATKQHRPSALTDTPAGRYHRTFVRILFCAFPYAR